MILAIDQGTSSTKCCLFDASGSMLGIGSVPVSRRIEADGSITQDPRELATSCEEAAERALDHAGLEAADVSGAALANQGESFLVTDRRGRALTPVISWQDSLVGDVLERPAVRDHATEILRRTGLPLHPEFVAPRLGYRLAALDAPHEARLTTLDTWLIAELSAADPFVTDRATASRTMLIGLEHDDWDEELLAWFGVDREILPTIVPCDRPGVSLRIGGVDLPLLASGYDMGLALLGHGCFQAGDVKATFGTCLGVMASTGSELVRGDGVLTSIAYTEGGGKAMALDGEIAAAGSLIDWAVSIGVAASADQLDRLAASVPDSSGVVLVPAINGLGAPHWKNEVEAAFSGMTSATGREQMARAVYDSIAWSIRDVLESMRTAGALCEQLRVDGGLTHRAHLMQICADICQIPIAISPVSEGTAWGAAALALLVDGACTREQVRQAAMSRTQVIEPGVPPSDARLEAWHAALRRVLD